MSVVILRKKFDTIPASTDIMQLLFGQDSGNRDNAKAALDAFLSPVKDLLDLLYLVDTMKVTVDRHIDLLKEQEVLQGTIENLKSQTAGAKKTYDAAANKQELLNQDIATLENRKIAIVNAIEDEETAKLRINKAVSAEYDRAMAAMLVQVAAEKKFAAEELATIEAKAKAAQTELDAKVKATQEELDNLADKKAKFIASLG